jgi:hypothetical protein
MITTKQEHLTKKEFFRLLIDLYLKKRWWFLVFIFLMALVQFSVQEKSQGINFFIIFALLYPLLLLYQYYRYAYSDKNENILRVRHHIITEDTIKTYVNDGSMSELKLSTFIKAEKIKQYYLLYLSKNQYLIIKEKEFASAYDRELFENKVFFRIKHQRV